MKFFRFAFLIALFLLAAGPAFAGEEKQLALLTPPPALRPQALVQGDVLLLGDLFDNLDAAQAKKPIAYAPKPGARATLDANWLYAVAQSQGIKWRPASLYDRIVVERASQAVPVGNIENALLSALAPHGVAADSAVELSNRQLSLDIPVDAKPQVAVRSIDYDDRSHRFTATIEVPAGSPNAQTVRIGGRVISQVEVPVLIRSIQKNEPIGAEDIKMVATNSDLVRQDTLVDVDQIVGKAPRHYMKVGQTINRQDVQRPVLVPKNSKVTMVLKSRTMMLTAIGHANEEGSEGDVIHVTNAQSHTIVEATVIGQGMVSVAPAGGSQVN